MRLQLLVHKTPLTALIKGMPTFLRNLHQIKRQARQDKSVFPFGKLYPCLEDRFKESGTASGHYFYQDLLVASLIFQNKPETHVDIGSRIDGFVAHVASFREIEVFDIRRLSIDFKNVTFRQIDIMNRNFALTDYCDSVSCLHALEHFGLGRYGDEVNFNGHLLGLKNIDSMLKKNGRLYLSVPIGPQRIEFDAHRVFSVRYLLDLLAGYQLLSFSYVSDSGKLIRDPEVTEPNIITNFGCRYSCGIFELQKLNGIKGRA